MGRRRNKLKNSCKGFIKPYHLQHNVNESQHLPSTSKQEFDVKKDNKCTRIILKEILYKDPYAYENSIDTDPLYKDPKFMKNYGIEWTTPNWQRAGNGEISNQQCNKNVMAPKKLNKLEKSLNKMLAQPVQMTKAEKMMAKMGWEGGALGKNGEGIIEPIAPNAAYATATCGLGKSTVNIKPPKKVARKQNKQIFKTNLLYTLLEFVKNDSEIEIAFDCKLSKQERKRIHDIVDALMTNDNSNVHINFNIERHKFVSEKIHNYNQYILNTESNGVPPNRYLFLYKDPPEYMYLVTPDDLCLKVYEDELELDNAEQNNQTIHSKIESVSTVNAKVEKNVDPDNDEDVNDEEYTVELLLETIIDYFMEFVENKDYTVFRFLGPFTTKEMEAINMFIEKYTNSQFYGNDALKCICKTKEIEIDVKTFNGSTVFYKLNTKPKN